MALAVLFALFPLPGIAKADIASSCLIYRETFKLSPLGANVKLSESGFAIYKSVIQREMSEIWASMLAGMAEPPAQGGHRYRRSGTAMAPMI